MVKKCIDCKFCSPSEDRIFSFSKSRWRFSRCAIGPDMSGGVKDYALAEKLHRKQIYCDLERSWGGDHCGPEAKNFQPLDKPLTWWKKHVAKYSGETN